MCAINDNKMFKFGIDLMEELLFKKSLKPTLVEQKSAVLLFNTEQ